MKKILIAFCAIALFSQCKEKKEGQLDTSTIDNPSSNGEIDSVNGAKIQFETMMHDFGQISEGAVVEHEFKFQNTGKRNLIISRASASCGCTVAEYTKEPVEPGEYGYIRAEFDSKGKGGAQEKTITVSSNAVNGEPVLVIKAFINKEQQQ